jgi:hypothetical protein
MFDPHKTEIAVADAVNGLNVPQALGCLTENMAAVLASAVIKPGTAAFADFLDVFTGALAVRTAELEQSMRIVRH